MDNSSGIIGENYVESYLKDKNFIIVSRNYRTRFGEIDIIAENESYIIFVEVKTRKLNGLTNPLESVTLLKQDKIIKAAMDFIQKMKIFKQPRFDVAAIYTADKEVIKMDYIENAF